MLNFLDPLRGMTLLNVVIKMFAALILGGVIGIERSYKNRPAGFRTHVLVTLGAAVASMTGIYLTLNAGLPSDIARIGAAVVSGLGFLGAGTIIVTRNYTVKGLTTAAGLWASGIIGLAVGAGFYEGAVITTVLILLAETTLGGIVNKVRREPPFGIRVLFRHKPALDQVLRICKNNRTAILNLQVVSAFHEEEPCYSAKVTLRPRTKVDHKKIHKEILAIKEILELSEVEVDETPNNRAFYRA